MLLNISSRGYGVNAQPCPAHLFFISAAAGEAAEDRSRELGLPLYKLERWRQKAEAALDCALKERETDAVIGKLATAMQRIGELSMEGSASGPWFAGPHSPWSDPSLHWLLGGSRHLVHQLRCVMGRSNFFARGRGAWRAESTPSPHDRGNGLTRDHRFDLSSRFARARRVPLPVLATGPPLGGRSRPYAAAMAGAQHCRAAVTTNSSTAGAKGERQTSCMASGHRRPERIWAASATAGAMS